VRPPRFIAFETWQRLNAAVAAATAACCPFPLVVEVPKDILRVKTVSREMNFSSKEMIRNFRWCFAATAALLTLCDPFLLVYEHNRANFEQWAAFAGWSSKSCCTESRWKSGSLTLAS